MIHDLSTQKGRNAYVKAMEKSNDTFEKYKINIEVRDGEGKIILDDNGNKVTHISFNVEMLTSEMEFNLRKLAKLFTPDRQINIEVYVYNSISGTYMNMFSFYVNEGRFVKH